MWQVPPGRRAMTVPIPQPISREPVSALDGQSRHGQANSARNPVRIASYSKLSPGRRDMATPAWRVTGQYLRNMQLRLGLPVHCHAVDGEAHRGLLHFRDGLQN